MGFELSQPSLPLHVLQSVEAAPHVELQVEGGGKKKATRCHSSLANNQLWRQVVAGELLQRLSQKQHILFHRFDLRQPHKHRATPGSALLLLDGSNLFCS